MAIKLIVSDLDGVVAPLKKAHFDSLNKALENIDKKYVITEEEHIKYFDGRSTKTKLNLLTNLKGLPKDCHHQIYEDKQKYTLELIESTLTENQVIINALQKFKDEGYKLCLASNAITDTINSALKKIGIYHFFDKILSNQDVKNQKPNSEIYLTAMISFGVNPNETIIIEDSECGRESAVLSGAFVCGVDNPSQFTYERIKEQIELCNKKIKRPKWSGNDTVVLIPMSGAGSRFKQKGYKLPKPLIDVFDKPMIQHVVENLNIDGQFVFVVQKQHYDDYNLSQLLNLIAPGCKIVITDGITQGAACSALLAKEFINNDKHLLIANSDQFVQWDSCQFMYSMISQELDGSILTFRANETKWSYAKENDLGYITEVKEKEVISDKATVGIYLYNKGSEFVHYAEQMISKNIRVNNEFYIAPIYNEYILDGKKLKSFDCQKMYGLGTPEDLEYFLENFEK